MTAAHPLSSTPARAASLHPSSSSAAAAARDRDEALPDLVGFAGTPAIGMLKASSAGGAMLSHSSPTHSSHHHSHTAIGSLAWDPLAEDGASALGGDALTASVGILDEDPFRPSNSGVPHQRSGRTSATEFFQQP